MVIQKEESEVLIVTNIKSGQNVALLAFCSAINVYEDAFNSFRTGHLEQELQMVELSANRCSCIAI